MALHQFFFGGGRDERIRGQKQQVWVSSFPKASQPLHCFLRRLLTISYTVYSLHTNIDSPLLIHRLFLGQGKGRLWKSVPFCAKKVRKRESSRSDKIKRLALTFRIRREPRGWKWFFMAINSWLVKLPRRFAYGLGNFSGSLFKILSR